MIEMFQLLTERKLSFRAELMKADASFSETGLLH